jgi:peptidoglycan LD-endopeptidase LytH
VRFNMLAWRLTLLLAPAFVVSACRRGPNASPPAPSPAVRPAVNRAPAPVRRAPPPGPRPAYVGTLDSAVTTADLDSLWAHQIIMPVEGIARRALRDNFSAARGTRAHAALDIPAPKATPVLAADDHIIGRLFNGPIGGIVIYATDPSGKFVYYYAHLDRYRRGLAVGDKVAKGSLIGYVGTTGNASPNAPHLHFQVMKRGAGAWWDGPTINPFTLFAPEKPAQDKRAPAVDREARDEDTERAIAPRDDAGAEHEVNPGVKAR